MKVTRWLAVPLSEIARNPEDINSFVLGMKVLYYRFYTIMSRWYNSWMDYTVKRVGKIKN